MKQKIFSQFKDNAKYSEQLRGMCARVHDCVFYYVDPTTEAGIKSVTESEDCPYRKYEDLPLSSLKKKLTTTAKQWDQTEHEDATERVLGHDVLNAASASPL